MCSVWPILCSCLYELCPKSKIHFGTVRWTQSGHLACPMKPVLDSWDRLLSLLPRTRYVENFFVGSKRFVLHLKEFFVWLVVSLVMFVEPYLTLQMHIFTHYFQRRFTIYYLILIVCSTGFYQEVINVPSMALALLIASCVDVDLVLISLPFFTLY